MGNDEKPGVLVSVCVVAYRQVDFIAQCLTSIVSQITDFEFEVIVGDDCSTDGTREVIAELARQYPEKIIPLLHDKNLGATKNYLSVHEAARGKYIAHCDGDDYWLPGKLAHQVAMLEEDNNLAFVGETEHNISAPLDITVNELLEMANPVVHSSKVYRRDRILTRHAETDLLDFYMHVEHARSGKIRLEKSRFTFYRRNVGVLHRMGLRFYQLNCEAAYRAYQLGAKKASAHRAARSARLSLIKQCIFYSDWVQLDVLLKPADLEVEMAPSEERTLIEKFASVRSLRPLLTAALRTKRLGMTLRSTLSNM